MNALYDKGADVVIGFRIEVNVDQTYVWTKAFMKSIALGNTIEDALEDADYVLDNDDTIPDYNVYTVSEINRYIRGSIYSIPCS